MSMNGASNVRPDRYDRKAVTEQLRYGGVLQAAKRCLTDSPGLWDDSGASQVVQVSRAGYPVRINHQECTFLGLSKPL